MRFRALLLALLTLAALTLSTCGAGGGSPHARLQVRPSYATVHGGRLRVKLIVKPGGGASSYDVTLSWTLPAFPATTGYNVFLNGSQVGSVLASPYVFQGLACATTYTLGVQAHDGSGGTGQTYSTSYTTPACPPGTLQPQGAAASARPGGGLWTLAYDEEFSGSSIPSGWANPGFFGNNLTPTGSLATVSGGDLHILRNSTQTASIQNCTNAGNSSQAAVNGNSWLLPVNGYVEASIYLPASGSALYNWNAGLWTTTSDGAELDIEENLAGVATPTYHWPVGNQTRGPTIGTFATVGNGFHTFGALRLTSTAQVYMDGALVWTVTTHDAGHPMCLNINSGSGQSNTDATTSPNNEMQEDWIHGWT